MHPPFGKKFRTAFVLVALVVIVSPLFVKLGRFPMMRWDEARYAASSYELLQHKNPLIVTWNGQPETLCAKPPLLNWVQALSITIFGMNEFAVRLPSALAGLAACLLILYFSRNRLNSIETGIISCLVLVSTSEGITGFDHSFRTADYDALLTFFSSAGAFMFFSYIQTDQRKDLRLSVVLFMFAILTKGAAGLFYLPGLAVYALCQKKFISLVKTKTFYLSAITAFIVLALVLGAREYFSPGYFKLLNEADLFGRYGAVIDNHDEPWWFYFDHFVNVGFGNWYVLLLCSWILAFFIKDHAFRAFSFFSFIVTSCFYTVLISSKSKLAWYDLPLYPLLAVQAGLFIWFVVQKISAFISSRTKIYPEVIQVGLCVAIFVFPFKDSFYNACFYEPNEGFKTYNNLSYYLKEEPVATKNAYLVANAVEPQQDLYYYHKLNAKGYALKFQMSEGNYSPGDKLIVNDTAVQARLQRKYLLTSLDSCRHLRVYQVAGLK